MMVQWSNEALREMESRFGADAKIWTLVYDTEGCGCAVNGVPALWAQDGPEPGHKRAESEGPQVWHEPRHEVFFEERLRVGYLPEHRSFTLTSDGQIYTNRLRLLDRRTSAA